MSTIIEQLALNTVAASSGNYTNTNGTVIINNGGSGGLNPFLLNDLVIAGKTVAVTGVDGMKAITVNATASTSYGIVVSYTDPNFTGVTTIAWTYDAPASPSNSTIATDLYNTISPALTTAGYTVYVDSAVVVIVQPSNTLLNVQSMSSSSYGDASSWIASTIGLSCTRASGSATVTAANTHGIVVGQTVTGTGVPANTTIVSVTENTSFVMSANASASGTSTLTFGGTLTPRVGYGSDLISQGWPTASTSSANDGIYSTNYYTVYAIQVSDTTPAGKMPVYTKSLAINTGSGNASTLISTLDTAFGI